MASLDVLPAPAGTRPTSPFSDADPASLDNAAATSHPRGAATVLQGDRVRLVVNPQAVLVVRLPPGAPHPEWAAGPPLVSITRTADETSVVCATSCVPDDVPGPVEGPLVAVTVDEVLEFSQVGILVSLLKPLADAGIPVLTVSTFDTDWVLLPAAKAPAAASVWRAAGHEVEDFSNPTPAYGVPAVTPGDGAGAA
jgi:hypothetical protein